MDVAVPEAGHDRLAGAIDDARIGRNLHSPRVPIA
jgi:hypothetical protein